MRQEKTPKEIKEQIKKQLKEEAKEILKTKEKDKILKWEYNKEIKAGSLNIKGIMKPGKREEIEIYMRENDINILLIQETFVNTTCIETRKNYTFYFSGDGNRSNTKGEVDKYTPAGVGIVINNELRNYIEDIDPINDRIMSITLGNTMPTTFINNYSRPATKKHSTEDKIEHYEKLKETQLKHQGKGPTFTMGDFNARIQRKLNEQETPIGKHTFDKKMIG